jgi:hypothetical protein
MDERFIGYTDQPPVDLEAPQPRFAGAMDHVRRAAAWAAPVANEALRQETGRDVYDFMGRQQPELNQDQQFGAGVARWALRRVGEHMAERAAHPA